MAGTAAVTLQWPPAENQVADPGPQPLATVVPVRGSMSDPRLIGGITEITATIAAQLDDDAAAAEVIPVIRDAARRWLEGQVRSGLLPASAGAQLEDLVAAVYDRRYGLGPLSVYLRDPQVENIDINGFNHVWITYASGERVAGPPVAANDDALISMVRTWATRGGQTARDFSAAAPLVNVAVTGGARLTATMSVTPRPCVSLRRHGQIDATLGQLAQLGTLDATLEAFLVAAVKSRCNVIVTGGVNVGNTTLSPGLSVIPAAQWDSNGDVPRTSPSGDVRRQVNPRRQRAVRVGHFFAYLRSCVVDPPTLTGQTAPQFGADQGLFHSRLRGIGRRPGGRPKGRANRGAALRAGDLAPAILAAD
jgi:hypothetical protein